MCCFHPKEQPELNWAVKPGSLYLLYKSVHVTHFMGFKVFFICVLEHKLLETIKYECVIHIIITTAAASVVLHGNSSLC